LKELHDMYTVDTITT